MDIKIKWSDLKKDKVMFEIIRFILKHKVSHGEDVQQCDAPATDSVNLVSLIVDILKPEIIDD